MRLYRIEITDEYGRGNTHYEYGETDYDAYAACVERHFLVNVSLREVTPAKLSDVLDAAKDFAK